MNDFINFLNDLLGTYTPVTDSLGNIPSGIAGVDFPFVFRGVVFCLVIYSVLKLLGGVICKSY